MKKSLLTLATTAAVICSLSLAQNPPAEPAPQLAAKPQPTLEPQPAGQPAADPVPVVPPAPTRREVRYRTVTAQPAVEEQRATAEVELARAANAFAPYQQKMEKGSYLGIASSPVPAVLREQLKLQSGVGLVVDRVDEKSPAEAGGVKPFDVIQKLDDQTLINPHQFGVLVRTLKPEQEVTLSIIRETKPMELKVKPIEKEIAVLDYAAAFGQETIWRGDRVNTGNLTITTPRKPALHAYGGMAPGGADNINFERTEMVTVGKDNVMIKTSVGPKGERTLTATDTLTGKIIFDGPVDTEEQRKELPPAIAEQFKAMDQMVLARPPAPVRVLAGAFATPRVKLDVRRAGGADLPRPKTVSGSDDDYTWEFTTKTGENGNAELELLLLDKNGKILFQGPFSRTRDLQTLPATVSQRLSSSPWDILIEDLKSAAGGRGTFQLNIDAAPPQPKPR